MSRGFPKWIDIKLPIPRLVLHPQSNAIKISLLLLRMKPLVVVLWNIVPRYDNIDYEISIYEIVGVSGKTRPRQM